MAPNSNNQEPAEGRPAKNHRMGGIPGWVGIGLFIYASVFALSLAKDFLVPVVLAFLLAMVFGPIRRFFDRRGVPAAVSSLLIVLVLLFSFVAIASALAVPARNWVNNAPSIAWQVEQKLRTVSRSLHGLLQADEKIKKLSQTASDNVQHVKIEGTSVTTSALLLAPSVITQLIFTLVLLFFLLASGDMFYEKLVHVMPTFQDKKRAMRIAHTIERKLSHYLLTITAINACLGVAVGLAMALLGMPEPLVFGVAAFVLNFIPYLGALIGIVIAASVAVISFDWIGWAPVVAATYFSLTAVEGQFITPYFIGRNLRLNTVVVFIAVSFWAWLWSAVGMIVAVPLLVAVKTFCEHIDDLEGLGHFLSERHAEARESSVTDVEQP